MQLRRRSITLRPIHSHSWNPAHALATRTGGRPSGGRPCFLPVPPPPPVPAPPAAPAPAPVVAFFFFGVCACGLRLSSRDCSCRRSHRYDQFPPSTGSANRRCSTRVSLVASHLPLIPTMTPTDTPATVVPAVTAPVAGPATPPPTAAVLAAAAAPSFGLVFDPPAAVAAMAALLGRIAYPSGSSFV